MEGNLEIDDNDQLVDLAGLGKLATIEGNLIIKNHPGLIDLDELAGVSTFGPAVHLRNNYKLESISGLVGVTSLDILCIAYNPLLPNCAVQELMTRTGVNISNVCIRQNLSDDCPGIDFCPTSCP